MDADELKARSAFGIEIPKSNHPPCLKTAYALWQKLNVRFNERGQQAKEKAVAEPVFYGPRWEDYYQIRNEMLALIQRYQITAQEQSYLGLESGDLGG